MALAQPVDRRIRFLSKGVVALTAVLLLALHSRHAYQSAAGAPPVYTEEEALTEVLRAFRSHMKLRGPPSKPGRDVARWLANIAYTYSEQYALTGSAESLDSTRLLLTRVVGMDSLNPDYAYHLASINMECEDYPAAEYYYHRVLTLDSTHVPALYCLGLLYWRHLSSPDTAIVLLRRASAASPAYPGISLLLGQLLLARGETQAGLAHVERESTRASVTRPGLLPGEAQKFAALASRNASLGLMSYHADRPGGLREAEKWYRRYMALEPDQSRRATITNVWRSIQQKVQQHP